MLAQACLQRQKEGRCLGSRNLGRGSCGPQAHLLHDQGLPSPLAQTVDGEHPPFARCPSLRLFPCFLPGMGSLSPGAVARGSLLSWPEPPLHRVTLADAAPDCVLSRIQNTARGTAVPILWLFVENHEDDFLSPALSGEKSDPSLLRPQAPGCPPWLGVAVPAANLCGPCLCGWLLSEGACRESCELRRRQ